MVFERWHIRQVYFILVALFFETEFYPPQADFIVTVYKSQLDHLVLLRLNQQCWDDTCVPAWLTWHPPACHSWGGSWCVHMCLRMERPEVHVVHLLLSSSTFLHEPEFLAELASHCFGWINRTTKDWHNLSPPLHHWVMGT